MWQAAGIICRRPPTLLTNELAGPSRGCGAANRWAYFSIALDWFCALQNKGQFKAEGTRTLAIRLPRPIPGSAVLLKVLDQASAKTK